MEDQLKSAPEERNMSDVQSEKQRELTFGEKAVGLTFNPGGHAEVNNIKRSFADTIDYLNNLRNTAKTENNGENIRMYSVAITECQSAQMWAVKAATWQF